MMKRMASTSLYCWIAALCPCILLGGYHVGATKIAVIGGGLSGSFVAKYLSDYDKECEVESITIFEPRPANQTVDPEDAANDDWQGSRISTLQLRDGMIVELGSSSAHKAHHLIIDMIHGDPTLKIAAPFSTGTSQEDLGLRGGVGVYNGEENWPRFNAKSSIRRRFQIGYRYGSDLVTLNRINQQAQEKLVTIPYLLASERPDTFYDSPDDIWKAINLENAIHSSFDELLNVLKVSPEVGGWRAVLPGQGSLRNELLAASNLAIYNQDNSMVNGITGLAGYAMSTGSQFTLAGGNFKLIESAIQQAKLIRKDRCRKDNTADLVNARVSTVVGGLEGINIFGDKRSLGTFDIVVLAAPLQQAQIEFLIESHMDRAVLQPMPLAGLIDHEVETDEGHDVLPRRMSEPTRRPFRQVVTTIVSGAKLAEEVLGIPEAKAPRSISFTSDGKAALHNITSITQIESSGVYRILSDEKLEESALAQVFGHHCVTEFVKVWGGSHGGATPDYQGQGETPRFLLYDGAHGLEGYTSSGAVYYPSAMEQSGMASMEISAVGAKSVAKLIAKRLDLIKPPKVEVHDEL